MYKLQNIYIYILISDIMAEVDFLYLVLSKQQIAAGFSANLGRS